MRLYFDLTPNTSPVPFEYQHFLIGAFHKWMGANELHDTVSLYSLSWLSGGKINRDCLDFTKGAKWFTSFHKVEDAKRVLAGALKDPEVCCGMKVTDVQVMETPSFGELQRFLVSTPVLVRKFDGQSLKHFIFSEEETDALLTQTMNTKLSAAGLTPGNCSVGFDRTYAKARTKLVTIRGIQNRASLCPVIVKGSPEVVAFAWEVGVGHSTGSGFGALC